MSFVDALRALDADRSVCPESVAAFNDVFPPYQTTSALDDLRARGYGRLDQLGHVYLDYTGGGLYAASQVEEFTRLLEGNVFGNPHSLNPTAQAMTALVEQARASVLAWFNASPDEYDVVFTQNATGALRLVGESYPFDADGAYLLTADNHNSVNGIREYAWARGAAVDYAPLRRPELRIDETALTALLDRPRTGDRLFAYPAQSNFSGVQHSLDWIARAKTRDWDVLLDAAAFVPTNRLDLSQVQPDFVSLSFYKMFGFPTGVGCLIARNETLARLRRPWFAGGTISLVSVQGRGWHQLLRDHAGFEDGTVNYLSLAGVEIGLRHMERVGIDRIHERVRCLTGWLLREMSALRHANGQSAMRIFGPADLDQRGGTIAFVFLDPEGEPHDFRHVEALAAERLISLRTGCFCNPGAGETAHELSAEHMRPFFESAKSCSFDDFYAASKGAGRSPSTMRVSVGIASNFADIDRFLRFATTFVDRSREEVASAASTRTETRATADTA